MILAQGLAIVFNRSAGNGAVSDYIARVLADGGTIENEACLATKVAALDSIALLYWGEVEDFETRVTGDSGTFEGFLCVREKMITLGEV